MSRCWGRPSLTAAEVAWRWVFGIPAAALIWSAAIRVVHDSGADLGLLRRISLIDPEGAAAIIQSLWTMLRAGIAHAAAWLLPSLFAAWVVISAFGRTMVLRRADAGLHGRPAALMALHAVRAAALLASFALWWLVVDWAAHMTVTAPISAGQEPNTVLYAACVIVATLVLFTTWLAVSWVLAVAPLVAMQCAGGALESLRATLRLGPVRGKLMEINLVTGIVKIALIVLAMVASASPLPLASVLTPQFMMWWYVAVGVAYLIASDFFHVVRLMAYLEIWRVYATQRPDLETAGQSEAADVERLIPPPSKAVRR